MHWPIIRRCLYRPTRLALTDDARAYRRMDLIVAALHAAGEIERRSRSQTIGVLLPTGGAFAVAALGAWFLGRTVVPLNYLLKLDELGYVIRDCGCDAVITAGPMLQFMGYRPGGASLIELDGLDFRSVPEARWPANPDDADLALLLYTSGTSGRPKGVMLSHGNLRANVKQVEEWVDFTERDVVVGVLPQFHSFGLTVLTLLPLSVGCPVHYSARFVPARIVRKLREKRPTVLVAIPSMYHALLHVKDARREDFATLRFVVSGGEPLPRAVFDGFLDRFGVRIHEGYGLTETAPVANWCRPHEFRLGCVGRPLPGVIERIVDQATGRDLGPGVDGEIRIAGPNVMRGYYRLPELTEAAFDERGFFRTGDIGRTDPDGSLYITGRLKEMLIVGGENVFPREIEDVIGSHPAIKDCGVVGMVDPMRGEVPVAFVELNADPESGRPVEFEPNAVLSLCRQRLAGYKVPSEVRVLPVLPRSATGKVLRRELRALV
ncbi:MAG: AMP-binding protein [Phycisphaerae bacterium]|nr:AMP-binding protein [Phycisphaerae bacterium]